MINKLICGDNLEVLRKIPKESIDLIYIDPPFFTNKQYEVVWGDEAETRSFEDRWEGGVEHFISWLKPRVQAMHDVLKPTGSFYLHCDWHANAHIRIMLDKIFGKENFQNEIIWHYTAGARGKNRWARKHDNIYFYTKSGKWTFNWEAIAEPFTSGMTKWRYTKGGQKEKSMPIGRVPDDVFNIQIINTMAKERVGYPTQKPEALLERIIRASSNPGDVVADFFCGCGTTVAVAQKLKRKWIGVDISPTAIKIMERRLEKWLNTIKGRDYVCEGIPTTIEDVRKLKPFEFQNWVIIDKLECRANKKKVNDKGLDGYCAGGTFQHPEAVGIQVKQSDKVGRNVVDNFETAIRRAGWRKGIIVAFSFTKDAHEEVARIKNKGELDIKLVTVKELLK